VTEPVPSTVTKAYPQRGPLQQFRFVDSTAFICFRCGESKKSKLITVYNRDWSKKLCNGCYGRLLSLYEIKAGTAADDQRAEELAASLVSSVAFDDQRQAEQLFKTSERRAEHLSAEGLRFVATAEHVAGQLDAAPQLEWSPAVIGLCKAVEAEIVGRIIRPLSTYASREDLSDDKRDPDVGRMALFCSDPSRKPPELGTFAHFLQTIIHSQQRRQTSALMRAFLQAAAEWTGSAWILDPNGFHPALVSLITNFRNRAAHIDELAKSDYYACREFVLGPHGLLWKLILSTDDDR
jgi:hypothetical protein